MHQKVYILLKLKSSALQKHKHGFAHAQVELKLIKLNHLLTLIYTKCGLPSMQFTCTLCVWCIYFATMCILPNYISSSTHLPWPCPHPQEAANLLARSRKLQIELHSSLMWADATDASHVTLIWDLLSWGQWGAFSNSYKYT